MVNRRDTEANDEKFVVEAKRALPEVFDKVEKFSYFFNNNTPAAV